MIASSNEKSISYAHPKLLRGIEYLTQITCWVMSEAILQNLKDQVVEEEDEYLFEILHQHYTTNPMITREFAKYINDQVLFKADLKPLDGASFGKIMRAKGKF